MDDFCIPQGNRHIAMMPLRKNVPYPLNDSWKLMACPVCGQRCWLQTDKLDILKLINPRVEFRCTECALEESS